MSESWNFPILVVEDSSLINDLIRFSLEDIRYPIEHIVATSRHEAIRILNERNDIRAVFLDWHLPDGTARGIAHIIRETQKFLIEIIATSSDEDCRRYIMQEGWSGQCEKHEIEKHIRRLAEQNFPH